MTALIDIAKGLLAAPTAAKPSQRETIQKVARELAEDMVLYAKDASTSPRHLSKYARILRKAVGDVSRKHDTVLKSMVMKLKDGLRRAPSETDAWKPTLAQIFDEVFADRFHWGRLVTIYAFEAYLVQGAQLEDTDASSRLVAGLPDFLTDYVTDSLGEKIREVGGWDNFVEYLSQYDEGMFNTLWWSGMFAVSAVGAYTLTKL